MELFDLFEGCAVLNQAVKYLNNLLGSPPSTQVLHHQANGLQQEYAQVCEDEKHRAGEKKWHGSKITVLNLKRIQIQREHALEKMALFNARQEQIKNYLDDKIWVKLERQLSSKKSVEDLLILKEDWTGQEGFAFFNSEDLDLLLNSFSYFRTLLKNVTSDYAVDQNVFLKTKRKNKALLKKKEKALISAIGWRIHAASLKEDLLFDDAIWALNKRLEMIVGENPLIVYPHESVLSKKLNFKTLSIFSKILVRSNYAIDRDKWTRSHWMLDDRQQYPIKLYITTDQILPDQFRHLIPEKRSALDLVIIGEFIAYFYFSDRHLDHIIERWVLEGLEAPDNLLVFLNESFAQIDLWVQDSQLINLETMRLHSGFKGSIIFHELVASEKRRVKRVSNFAWISSKKLRNLLSDWEQLLDRLHDNVLNKIKAMPEKLLNAVDQQLSVDFDHIPYEFSKEDVLLLSNFFTYYGSEAENIAFKEKTSPVYFFKQNLFLKKIENMISIDLCRINFFSRYAQYWSDSDKAIAMRVIFLLLNKEFPENKDEDEQLILQLSSWFPTKKDVVDFLKEVGVIVAKTGTRSNPFAYRFLEQYASDEIAIWHHEKEKGLDEKYYTLFQLLDVSIGEEKDSLNMLNEADLHVNYLDYVYDLNNNSGTQHGTTSYVKTLSEIAEQYIHAYDGTNAEYLDLMYALSTDSDGMNLLEEYILKRIRCLFSIGDMNEPQPIISAQEILLYQKIVCDISKKNIVKNIANKILQWIVSQSDILFNKNTFTVVSIIDPGALLRDFCFKHFVFLLDNQDYNELYNMRNVLGLDDEVFNDKLNKYLRKHLKNIKKQNEENQNRDKLSWVVEYFGDQRSKEADRLLKIDYFLQSNNKDRIDEFIAEMIEGLETDDPKDLFVIVENQEKLAVLYEAYNKAMLEKRDWDGNAQYLMQTLNYKATKHSIPGARVAWLSEYLFHPHPFVDSRGQRVEQSRDLDVHIINLEVPNEDQSLQDFFGSHSEQVMKLIDDLFIDPNRVMKRKLVLMDRYIEDDFFKKDPRWRLWYKKLGLCHLIREIIDNVVKNEWGRLQENIDKIGGQFKAIQALTKHVSEEDRLLNIQEISYYKDNFIFLKKIMAEYSVQEEVKSNILRITKILERGQVRNEGSTVDLALGSPESLRTQVRRIYHP